MGLGHPEPKSEVVDKRTWRGERVNDSDAIGGGNGKRKEQRWTSMDVLTAYALRNGWVTAKAGRPDVNRAGNARKSFTYTYLIA